MALKTNIGISRKVADNNYGSRGANVNLEVELDSALINDPDRFHDRIRQCFRLAQMAVDDELNRQVGNAANSNCHASANGHGHATPRRSSGRRATASQARALRSIAERLELDLAAELQNRFGVDEPEQLSISEASQTIDSLNSSTSGVTNGRR
jgi:hypothetical protein